MRDRIRLRLSYANVMSSIAVFVVLGGGAYATIDRRIGTKDIKKNAVTTKKIKKQAVKAGKLAPNSVRTGKIADQAVTADKLAGGVEISGPQGPQGPRGEQGSEGPPGPSVAGFAVLRPGVASSLPSNGSFGTTVTLNTGADNTGPISVSFPARLIITGTTRLQNVDGSSRTIRCRLVLNPGGNQQVVSAMTSDSGIATNREHTTTVTGAVNVAPGTYNVGMQCATLLANPGGIFSDVSLTVVAVGR